MSDLFNGCGESASLKEVCEWWVKTYPNDIFVTEPKEVVEVRDLMYILLHQLNKKKGVS